ncbi:MAG: hypothetical protein GY793_08580 [Proteobacteria bacterium]|nr:hypothetical protein [Pseudomonadota bacterium]
MIKNWTEVLTQNKSLLNDKYTEQDLLADFYNHNKDSGFSGSIDDFKQKIDFPSVPQTEPKDKSFWPKLNELDDIGKEALKATGRGFGALPADMVEMAGGLGNYLGEKITGVDLPDYELSGSNPLSKVRNYTDNTLKSNATGSTVGDFTAQALPFVVGGGGAALKSTSKLPKAASLIQKVWAGTKGAAIADFALSDSKSKTLTEAISGKDAKLNRGMQRLALTAEGVPMSLTGELAAVGLKKLPSVIAKSKLVKGIDKTIDPIKKPTAKVYEVTKQVAYSPESIAGATYGIERGEDGKLRLNKAKMLQGALAGSLLTRVPVKGKTAFGKNSYAKDGLKAVANKAGKVKGLRNLHPTEGLPEEIWNLKRDFITETTNLKHDAATLAKNLDEKYTPAQKALLSDVIEGYDFERLAEAPKLNEPTKPASYFKKKGYEMGEFGPMLKKKGSWEENLEQLKTYQTGEIKSAISHPEIGNIDVIWGKTGTAKRDGDGLSKIIAFHPEVEKDLPDIIKNMEIKSQSKNRILLESADHKSTVSLNYQGDEKKWLLTAFKKADKSNYPHKVRGQSLSGKSIVATDTLDDAPIPHQNSSLLDTYSVGQKSKTVNSPIIGNDLLSVDKQLYDDAMQIKKQTQQFGKKLVDAGFLDSKTFSKNKGSYLKRYYAKSNIPTLEKLQSKFKISKFEKLKANSSKRRGETISIDSNEHIQMLPKKGKVVEVMNPQTKDKRYLSVKSYNQLKASGELDSYFKTKNFEIDEVFPDGKVKLWRDYTPYERKAMGEVRDAVYRNHKASLEMAHDLGLANMYKKISKNVQHSSDIKRADDWVMVPDRLIKDTGVKEYGALSGKWVNPDIMRILETSKNAINDTEMNGIVRSYLKALSLWKVSKTAYNPSTHFNNIMSNSILSMMTGELDPADLYKYGFKNLKNAQLKDDAIRAGLSIDREVGMIDAKELFAGVEKSDTTWGKMIDKFMNNKLTEVYNAEDSIFKLALYAKRVAQGDAPEEAVKRTHKYFFDYTDIPRGIKWTKNTVSPFIIYNYKIAQLLSNVAVEAPQKLLLPYLALSGLNKYSYGTLYGDGYETRENYEREIMPDYMKGRTMFGNKTNVRLPYNRKGDNAAMFLNIGNALPGGKLLDFTANNPKDMLGFAPQILGGSILGSNPFLNMLVSTTTGQDQFFGKEILPYPEIQLDDIIKSGQDGNLSLKEKRNLKAMGEFFAQQLLPPSIVYYPNKIGEAMVGDGVIDEESAIAEMFDWTGTSYSGRKPNVMQAIGSALGIKIKDVDFEEQYQNKIKGLVNKMQYRDSQEYRKALRNKSLSKDELENFKNITKENMKESKQGLEKLRKASK